MATATSAPTLKTIEPATGRCSLTLTINGTVYRVTPIPAEGFGATRAYRLRKSDGTTYDLIALVHGAECDCPDFTFHRNGLDPAGCKHIKAAKALGLL